MICNNVPPIQHNVYIYIYIYYDEYVISIIIMYKYIINNKAGVGVPFSKCEHIYI